MVSAEEAILNSELNLEKEDLNSGAQMIQPALEEIRNKYD